jgi:outer membrane protein assembly factor BamE (lipoprotein component of BamABCDE complex)
MTPDELARAAEAIPLGADRERVRASLGEPLVRSELTGGGESWLYVEADPARGQRESLSVGFDEHGRYLGLQRKPLD